MVVYFLVLPRPAYEKSWFHSVSIGLNDNLVTENVVSASQDQALVFHPFVSMESRNRRIVTVVKDLKVT